MNVPTKVRAVALTVMAGLLAACSESPTGMAVEQSQGLRPPHDVAATGASLQLAGDTQTSITVDPTVTSFYSIGAHWVYIPRGAICRLDSSYGVGEWDKPCESETQRITIPVTIGERNGHALVVFGKDMRFRPTDQPREAVYLYLHEPGMNTAPYSVLWQAPDGAWVDEAATDPTLRAFRVNGRWIGRRVKHFSGYNVSLGYSEEQSDPTAY